MANIENIPVSTTNKSLYIVSLNNPDERMEIQFVPQKLQIDSTANHAKIEVVGRNNPLYHYTTGEDNLNLILDLYADDDDKLNVIQRVRWLQSLRYNDGISRRKKNVMLIFGDLFINQNMTWIVTSVSVSYSDFHELHNFRPQQAMVDLKLSLDPGENLKESDFK